MSQVFAARAIAEFGSDKAKHQLARHMCENSANVPAFVAWDAIERLLPAYLSIDDMMMFVSTGKSSDSFGLRYQGATLAERLEKAEELEKFLSALLTKIHQHPRDAESKRGLIEHFAPALITGAVRLLRRSESPSEKSS